MDGMKRGRTSLSFFVEGGRRYEFWYLEMFSKVLPMPYISYGRLCLYGAFYCCDGISVNCNVACYLRFFVVVCVYTAVLSSHIK